MLSSCAKRLLAFRIESSYFPVAASGIGLLLGLIGTAANGGNPQCFEMVDSRELQLKRLQGNSMLLSFFALVFWLMLRAGLQNDSTSSSGQTTKDIFELQNLTLFNQRVLVAQQATTYLLLTLLPATALTIFMTAHSGICLTSDVRLASYGLVASLSADMIMRHVIMPFGQSSQSFDFEPMDTNLSSTHRQRCGTGSVKVSAWSAPTLVCLVFTLPSLLGVFVDVRVGAAWLLASVSCLVAYLLFLAIVQACKQPSAPAWCKNNFHWIEQLLCSCRAESCQRFRLKYSLVRLTSAQRADGVAQWKASFSIIVILSVSLLALLCYELGVDFKCAYELLSERRGQNRLPSLGFDQGHVARQLRCEGAHSDAFFGAERVAVIVQSVMFFCFLIQLVFMVVWERIFLKLAIATHKEQAQQTTAMLRWLSHECRSPVAAAMLSMDYILQDCLPEVAALLFEKSDSLETADTGGLFGHVPMPVQALSNPSSPLHAVESSTNDQATDLAGQQAVLQKVHTALIDLKSSMDLVVQPLTSLSQVLDNMLLYMRRRSSAAVMSTQEAGLTHQLVPLLAWKIALQNATASHDVDEAQKPKMMMHLCVNASASESFFIAEGRHIFDRYLEHLTCQSSATQATVLQVLTNYLTNALKYGKLTSNSRPEICISMNFVAAQAVLSSSSSPTSPQGKKRRSSKTQIKGGSASKVGILPMSAASEALAEHHLSRPPSLSAVQKTSRTNTSSDSHSSDPSANLTQQETLVLLAVAKRARAWSAAVSSSQKSHKLQQELHVSTTAQEPGVLVITIQDWGKGMSDVDMASLFQPFSRLRSGAAQKGNGLGLWLMKELVETQGARVTASSPGEGLGCSFSVFLPIQADFLQLWQRCGEESSPKLGVFNRKAKLPKIQSEPLELLRSPSIESKQSPLRASSLGGHIDGQMRILVVDDSPANRSMMVRQLKRKGYHVDSAEDGTDGFTMFCEAVHKMGYDLIISDMTMPTMNGDELAKNVFAKLKTLTASTPPAITSMMHHTSPTESQPNLYKCPIFIGVTGNAMQEDIDLFLAAGAHKVLSKPVSVSEVLQCFANLKEAS